MEAPLEFVRRYWNPAAVLDALDIKAWPPSADEVHESFCNMQQRPERDESARERRGEAAPSVAPSNYPDAGFSRQQQPQQAPPRRRPPSPPRPWLSPRDAALRIQSTYRGHQVREGMRRIAELEAEIGVVETRIMADLDKILGDGRERERVNQMIMDVLVRLDGVNKCYRPYRKRVIKKAISLQEALDQLVGGDGSGGADAADPGMLNQLSREANTQWIEEQGNCSHDEEEEDDEEEEEPSRTTCRYKDALVRVTEENTALRCFVGDLIERNEKQAAMMQQLTERVGDLEKKLKQLGRKRRRSRHAGGEEGGGRDAEAPTTSSSSSSAGEGHPDHD